MHTEQRTRPIFKVVLHDNEGPEGINSAAGLRTYLLRNGPDGGGYQAVFDDRTTVIVQPDSIECYANGAVNAESVDGCIIGYASQTAQQWADLFDAGYGTVPGAIEEAAQWFASKCRTYGIPAVHLTGVQLHDPNSKGICTHGDLTAAGYQGTEGHTDPGTSFPIEKFVTRIQAILSPPIDWTYLHRLELWEKAIQVRPLRKGDRGREVQILNDLLKAHHLLTRTGQAYGLATTSAVRHFKKLKRYKTSELNGKVFGARAAGLILHP